MSANIGYILAFALLACGGGCTAVIVPPPATSAGHSAPVLVADYGYHSTLILPRSQGGLVEYAYGDWTYFGQNRKSVGTALHALLASDQATLGRRVIDREPDPVGVGQATGAKGVIRFDAPRDKVRELEELLEARFAAGRESIVYSPVHQLYFVKDDERYGVANNCNHFTAKWLERLGCRVKGPVVGSGFKVREVAGAATATRSAAVMPTTQPVNVPGGHS
jgi:hypothetical protein